MHLIATQNRDKLNSQLDTEHRALQFII